jgi:hypothetical protein
VKWFVILVFLTAVGYGYFQVLVSAYLPKIGFDSGSGRAEFGRADGTYLRVFWKDRRLVGQVRCTDNAG